MGAGAGTLPISKQAQGISVYRGDEYLNLNAWRNVAEK